MSGDIKSKLFRFKNDKNILRNIKDEFEATSDVPNSELSLHICPMASGSAVIANEKYVNEFLEQQHRKFKGIDMEMYGVFYTCVNNSIYTPKCFAMKSVVDFADNYKSDNYHSYAAFTSANALHRFYFNYLY